MIIPNTNIPNRLVEKFKAGDEQLHITFKKVVSTAVYMMLLMITGVIGTTFFDLPVTVEKVTEGLRI
jgi:hypothetical protein